MVLVRIFPTRQFLRKFKLNFYIIFYETKKINSTRWKLLTVEVERENIKINHKETLR